jgi:hypothetical protein
MKAFVAVLLLAVAGFARAQAIGYEGARHLLNRAGFGATDAEVREYAARRLQAVGGCFADTPRGARPAGVR